MQCVYEFSTAAVWKELFRIPVVVSDEVILQKMSLYLRAAGRFHSHNHFDRRWRRHTCRTSSGIRQRWWELSAAATRPTSCCTC